MRGSLYDNFKDKLVQPNSGSEAFNSGVKQANSRARKLVKKLFDELETLRKKHTVFISKDEALKLNIKYSKDCYSEEHCKDIINIMYDENNE